MTKTFYSIVNDFGVKKIYQAESIIKVTCVGSEKVGTGKTVLVSSDRPQFFDSLDSYEAYLEEVGDELVEVIEKE